MSIENLPEFHRMNWLISKRMSIHKSANKVLSFIFIAIVVMNIGCSNSTESVEASSTDSVEASTTESVEASSADSQPVVKVVVPAGYADFKVVPAGYVDLGLPSGTIWKETNETGCIKDLYPYNKAKKDFGDQLPTTEQLSELKNQCEWAWDSSRKGYTVTGPNGNSIFLPAAGCRACFSDNVSYAGTYGSYWSSVPFADDAAEILFFSSDKVYTYHEFCCCGLSVRCVLSR